MYEMTPSRDKADKETLNADFDGIRRSFFCVFRAKMPIFEPVFVVFQFSREKIQPSYGVSKFPKKSNRANVGVIVQSLRVVKELRF